MICCKTIIGFGSPNKSGSHDSHGSPLGEAEVAAAGRNTLGWPYAPFEIPANAYSGWDAKDGFCFVKLSEMPSSKRIKRLTLNWQQNLNVV